MARPLRIEFAGALYHVTARGDRREDIYENNGDREAFISILADVCTKYNWMCHAYCLMDNHYHLLIETPDGNLSKGMRQLNGLYTQTYNRTHRRPGHVFQGRYKAILVEKDSYLREIARYIVLNPGRAGMMETARDWPWSSYRATVGLCETPVFLTVDWLLAGFGGGKAVAVKRYEQFVSEGKARPSPWKQLRSQICLGSEQFVEKMHRLIDGDQELSEIPLAQRRPAPDSLDNYSETADGRNAAIFPLTEVVGIH